MYLFKAPFNLYVLQNEMINISFAIKLFGITYSYFPFVAVTILAFISKKNIQLFGLCSFSILLPTVLFQYHPLSEHLIAIQIFWLFLAFNAEHSMYKYRKAINTLFIIILFFTHPVSSLLFVFWGLLNLHHYIKNKKIIKRNIFILYFCIGLLRFGLIYFTDSDQDTASYGRMLLIFHDILSLSKLVLSCFILIPVTLYISVNIHKKGRYLLSYLLFVFTYLLFLYIFFNIQEQVISILILRFFQFIVHLPFITLFYNNFIFVVLLKEKLKPYFILLSSFTFMLIVTTMAIGRDYSINKVINYYLSRNIHCIKSSQVNSKFNTLPFGHFATPFEITMHQKTLTPHFIILTQNDCNELTNVQESWINLYTSRKENIYPTINLIRVIKGSHE
jgi:hypothetical protein